MTYFCLQGVKRSVNMSVTEIITFHGRAGRQNLGYFSLMKYFGFMLLMRSVILVNKEPIFVVTKVIKCIWNLFLRKNILIFLPPWYVCVQCFVLPNWLLIYGNQKSLPKRALNSTLLYFLSQKENTLQSKTFHKGCKQSTRYLSELIWTE